MFSGNNHEKNVKPKSFDFHALIRIYNIDSMTMQNVSNCTLK